MEGRLSKYYTLFGAPRWDIRYGEREGRERSGNVEEGRRGGANFTSPSSRGPRKLVLLYSPSQKIIIKT